MTKFAAKATQVQRRGGKYEAIGSVMLIVGLIYSALQGGILGPVQLIIGAVLVVGGFVVFLVGRFM